MLRALDWNRDGADWPNRAASRFVEAGGVRWHVQVLGEGEPMLLVHGTASSTHSWATLAARLAPRCRLIIPDLPGHGFSSRPPPERLALPAMAESLAALLEALGERPLWATGHSAGVAVLLRMALDRRLTLRRLFSLNGAMLPLPGMMNPALAPLTRWLAYNEFVPHLFSRRAEFGDLVQKMMGNTGSAVPETELALYRRLASSPSHVSAALGMMAMWDTRPIEREIPRLATPLTLFVGTRDLMIPPALAERVQRLLPSAERVPLEGLGHLAHEERPDWVAREIFARMGYGDAR